MSAEILQASDAVWCLVLRLLACRYIGVTEADYEWITDEIVQVANRCVAAQRARLAWHSIHDSGTLRMRL